MIYIGYNVIRIASIVEPNAAAVGLSDFSYATNLEYIYFSDRSLSDPIPV